MRRFDPRLNAVTLFDVRSGPARRVVSVPTALRLWYGPELMATSRRTASRRWLAAQTRNARRSARRVNAVRGWLDNLFRSAPASRAR
jgi:hypothetical protein